MTRLAEYADARELTVNLILRELRGRYKRSALGWTWSLLKPAVDRHHVSRSSLRSS